MTVQRTAWVFMWMLHAAQLTQSQVTTCTAIDQEVRQSGGVQSECVSLIVEVHCDRDGGTAIAPSNQISFRISPPRRNRTVARNSRMYTLSNICLVSTCLPPSVTSFLRHTMGQCVMAAEDMSSVCATEGTTGICINTFSGLFCAKAQAETNNKVRKTEGGQGSGVYITKPAYQVANFEPIKCGTNLSV